MLVPAGSHSGYHSRRTAATLEQRKEKKEIGELARLRRSIGHSDKDAAWNVCLAFSP